MNTPKFKTADGKLTAYALACGYQETSDKGKYTTRLFKENGVYQALVRHYEPSASIRWETTTTLASARKALVAMVNV